jgi:hypothetical protein
MTYFNYILSEFNIDHDTDYAPNGNGIVYAEIQKYLTNPELGSIDIDEPVD